VLWPKSRLVRWLVPLTGLALLIWFHPVWLSALGGFLVNADEPFPAQMVVVPAGDGQGNRIRGAAELVRQGYAPRILVSGPAGWYGFHECDVAIRYAVKLGYPEDWFIALPHAGDSTREEAKIVLEELGRRQVRRFLVVTSTYHTRRARAVYRALAPAAELRVVAVADPYFTPAGWWRNRRGRKVFALEWQKTIAGWLGI
jgi:uncharacterized SAM-binding protein YcdF (DUF218 family)